jgi:DNA-directed RNA polymerase specialized sigma subunit
MTACHKPRFRRLALGIGAPDRLAHGPGIPAERYIVESRGYPFDSASHRSDSCNFFGPISVFILECKGNEKMKRQNLFQSIFNALNRWPELERSIFSRAHYHGQSVQAIAHSLQLDEEEVRTILRRCDRRLYSSLDGFRKSDCESLSIIMAEAARPAACGENFNGTHAIAFKVKSIQDISQTAV